MPAVRISDGLFQEAKKEAAAMSRSVAGQIEHWARLGQAVEAAGLAVQDMKVLFQRQRAAGAADPFAHLLQEGAKGVYEVPGAALREAKQARQKMDYEAQKAGLVPPSQASPFAGVRMSAKIRKVPLER